MHILVLNSGSSSIKFQLRDDAVLLCKGLIERIGEPRGAIRISASNGNKIDKEMQLPDHTVALQHLLEVLVSPDLGALHSLADIDAVGHRVVHGGEDYSDSVLVDEDVIQSIERLSSLAPLHNPPNLKGILA